MLLSPQDQLIRRYIQKYYYFRNKEMASERLTQAEEHGVHLQSVERIVKLPVVESTLQTGKNIYDKVKDYNSVTNWTISTAENTVCKAVEVGKPFAVPVINTFQGPIKKVDGYVCSGLDYVESKIPAVKLPPGELYNSTKDYVTSSVPVQKAMQLVEPYVESAKNTVEGAKSVIEPVVQMAAEKAGALKDYGTSKVEGYLKMAQADDDQNSDQTIIDDEKSEGSEETAE